MAKEVHQNQLTPKDPDDAARWEATKLSRRMLGGKWKGDVKQRMTKHLSDVRAEDMGEPTVALNVYSSLVVQTSILYDAEPNISQMDDEGTEEMTALLDAMHWAQLLARHNTYVVGLRESLIKVEDTRAGVRMTLVTPDTVTIKSIPGAPEEIESIREAITKPDANGVDKGYWLVWDLSDQDNPRHYIEDANGDDVSEEFPAEFPRDEDGEEDYEWYGLDNKPFVPFIKYRAAYTEDVWDPTFLLPSQEGTLDIAILWTMFFSNMANASWPQKFGLDVEVSGATQTKSGGKVVQVVNTSPTSILLFGTSTRGAGDKHPQMGQFQPGAEPKSFAEAVLVFQTVILSNMGINPADIEQTRASASGVAIQLKRSAQRKTALKYMPSFRIADKELLTLIAKMYNINSPEGTAEIPETGWNIHYVLPEMGADEQSALIKQDAELIAIGLGSKVDLMMKLHPELKTRDAAIEKLKEIALENRTIA